jgi:hypothetical protein
MRFLNELSTKIPRHGAASIHQHLELRLPLGHADDAGVADVAQDAPPVVQRPSSALPW